MPKMTYSRAGVSTARGDQFVDLIVPLARKTHRAEIVTSVGGFSALSKIPNRYRKPLLVVSTDGVGTKVLLARECEKYDTVGVDLVAMSANDILTCGAEPFLFLDYWATSHVELHVGRDIVEGIVRGCKQAGCALVGGETAEMPAVYRKGDFDLAGFCVGIVDGDKVVDGRSVCEHDVLVGIPSNGIHSNGYSLVRSILRKKHLSLRSHPGFLKGRTLGEELLRPTRIYVSEVRELMKSFPIKAMAHITGGGLEGNLPRVLPSCMVAEIYEDSWKVPPIFWFLAEQGNVCEREMYSTFNMGIGFVLVVSQRVGESICRKLRGAQIVGKIKRRKNKDPDVLWRSQG